MADEHEHLFNETQWRILEAATKVFSEKGFNGATTSEIARKAGVAEGTIFRYYKTKKDLLLGLFIPAAISFTAPLVIKDFTALIEGKKQADEKEVLTAVLKSRLALFRKNYSLFKMLVYEAQFHPEIKEKLVSEIIDKVRGVMLDYIETRKMQGKFRDIDTVPIALSIIGAIWGMLFYREMFPAEASGRNEDKDIEAIVDILLNGLRAK